MSVSRFVFSVCLATVLFGLASHAQAAIIWDNGDGTWEWNTANNWNPNTVPTSSSGSDGFFDASSPSGTPITVTGQTPTARHIAFGSGDGTLSPVASYTFNDGGSGELRIRSGGFLQNFSDSLAVQTFNVNYTQAGSSTINPVGGGFVFNGLYTATGNLTIDNDPGPLAGISDKPISFNGDMAGAGIMTINSPTPVTLAGTVTRTGVTNINNGVLTMNGTHTGGGAYTVASGATLAGTGTIDIAANNMTVNGTLSPGASIESLGVTAALVELNGTLFIEFDDTASQKIDLLNVTGNLDITDAALSLDDISFGDVGLDGVSSYIFATYTGSLLGAGAFDSDPLPAGYEVDYDFGGNNIALVPVPVPEPGTIVLASLGCIGLGLLRMRKQA